MHRLPKYYIPVTLFIYCTLMSSPLLADQGLPRETHAPTIKLDYNRDVRPILAAKCFHCHGADPKAIQAGLRLDNREGAVKLLASGHTAIVPAKPALSEVINRIFTKNGGIVMPPLSANKALKPAEQQIIKRWIAQGAEYKQHWAFIKPLRPIPPAVKFSSWARNPIDKFVLARIEKEHLKPSPETDKATLIRRVSLDITGIPPTISEVRSFLADKSPKAYEKVVDRLFTSPRYGEKMAQSWMDGARYADSNGYQADYERFQWRWRDWVIDAYNNNMPYNQFTIEQLAGDMLPNATLSQKIATGFNRNHRINTEGGVIPEEWRLETVIDRVETTSAVWLGLTMGCARCHDHKYDPITQKEFYQFGSYFNNVPETGSGEERPVNHPPLIKAPYPEQAEKLAGLDSKLAPVEAWLKERITSNESTASTWKIDNGPIDKKTLMSGIVARYRMQATPLIIDGNAAAPKIDGKIKFETGRGTGAAVLDGSSYIDLGETGDFDTKDSFSYGAWVNPATGSGVPLSRFDGRGNDRGWDIFLADGHVDAHLVNKWPVNALKIVSKQTIPNNQWTHIFVTYNGLAKPDGMKLYINGKSVDFDIEANTLTDSIRASAPVTTKIGSRSGSDNFKGKIEDVAIFKRTLKPEEVFQLADADPAKVLLAIAPEKRTPDQKKELSKLWSESNDPDYKVHSEEHEKTAKERSALDSDITTVMVMEEMPKPRECFVLVRGQYDKHGEAVTSGLPAVFPKLPNGEQNNRLGLAKWIASTENPLTARVAVNRLWEKYFGLGIVQTTEDFGTRAEYPSNPELLDWLATEFVRLNWDLKALQKEIVMSAAYRQSSKLTPELKLHDPENHLLARGPRFRLSAEVIRDQALAISGLLVEKIGGRSVRPYQPEGIWNEINVYGNLINYQHDKGDGLYRRSLYTIWKRTQGPPSMSLFDVPGRDTCRVRRSRTNTPLQALALMNEITFVEASRVFAQRILTEGGSTPAERINYAFERAMSRRPNAKEGQILLAGQKQLSDQYRANPEAATKLVSIGDSPRDPKIDASELAAYTITASIILNMDETISKE